MNLLDKIFYRKLIVQQAQDMLNGTYKHFMCDECCRKKDIRDQKYVPRWKCMDQLLTDEFAEKMHDRWRNCKKFYKFTDGGF